MARNNTSNLSIISADVGPFYSLADFQENYKRISGIYLVYRKNLQDQKLRLIYIGQAQDLSERVNSSHEHYNDWLTWAYGEESNLYFSAILINDPTDILRCEAALIYKFKPQINTSGIDSFIYDDTVIIFRGKDVCGKKIIYCS